MRLAMKPCAGKNVWEPPELPGYLESIQAAGAFAAPLLATASFTLVALVLQASAPFARWPDLALLFFVGAGLAQVFAVQCAVWTRRYMTTPDELKQWYPDDFEQDGEQPTPLLLNFQISMSEQARAWAGRTVRWLNTGIALLLAGVAVSVVPHGRTDPSRWVVIAMAFAGVTVESFWVIAIFVRKRVRPKLRRVLLIRIAMAGTSGTALIAAIVAGLSGAPPLSPATWWAVALTVVTVAPPLARLTGLRMGHRHLWFDAPRLTWPAIADILTASIPPVALAANVLIARRILADERDEELRKLHPEAAKILPRKAMIRAHHRAVTQCAVSPADAGELSDLPAIRWPHSPICATVVHDRGDWQARFGYFIAYPLLAETTQRIRAGQLTSCDDLAPADLASAADVSSGTYVSLGWAATPAWTHQCVVAALVESVAGAGAHGEMRPVFVHAETARVRALLSRYAFAPLIGEDGIWALERRRGARVPAPAD